MKATRRNKKKKTATLVIDKMYIYGVEYSQGVAETKDTRM